MLPQVWKEPIPEANMATSLGSHKVELTDRQTDCLLYLVKGMTIKEIAKELNLAPKTIEHYLTTVKTKLNCHSRSSLITRALTMQTIKERLNN